MTAIDRLLSTKRPFVNDGGIETTLIFHDGFDLPLFAAYVLYETDEGRAALTRYFERYIDIAEQSGRGFLLDTATWRANAGWCGKLGHSEDDIRRVNRQAVEMAKDLRATRAGADGILINGVIGPAGDGYAPEQLLTAAAATTLHRPQIEALAMAGADLASAMTMTHTGEALGVARAAAEVGLPIVLSFTLETDGNLPDGTALEHAIRTVDNETGGQPIYYGINCAHPSHFMSRLSGGDWVSRIGAVRANASRLSHAELDEASTLDEGNPTEFGMLYGQLAALLPGLRAVGGCCGTDHRHIAAVLASSA